MLIATNSLPPSLGRAQENKDTGEDREQASIRLSHQNDDKTAAVDNGRNNNGISPMGGGEMKSCLLMKLTFMKLSAAEEKGRLAFPDWLDDDWVRRQNECFVEACVGEGGCSKTWNGKLRRGRECNL
ncbi:hypothetical protein NPIL_179291 [Nephila pilipes]|uniref:Uncharacterized protein n=1 Tax=Nephila pilipes TaxID=299642 RepID=A0A8X6TGI5_NEPPI|nr:hypothetical protein NPIL_179291 [Nephila pilipes]